MAADYPQGEPGTQQSVPTSIRLALYQPDIPQNTGTILRLAACLGVGVDVIAPTGFDMTDRALRRAGLDYLAHVEITRHSGFAAFDTARRTRGSRLLLLSSHASRSLYETRFCEGDVLLLGRESSGAPDAVHAAADERITIPMRPGLRSLNIAVAAAMALGEALRQTSAFVAPTDEAAMP
ncbi:MAG: tRNA (cytidine(34)-2'-O)-methyltransferase [Hyphomicrobiaceae bacterium]|nr:tRNA (cytidine(34)-2'-O)-methyltransferase [Hyphomicrobiaceae bacterium]